MIRVGVVGATGKMGREICRAVAADPDLTLVAAISRSAFGSTLADAIGLEGTGVVVEERLQAALDAGVEVLVDFTAAAFAPEHVAWAIEHGVHVVEGTTGFAIDEAWRRAETGVFVAPNFAIGAVLMMRFAEQAARHLPAAEVIELHHDGKKDAPSGTAIATARRIAAAREGVAAPRNAGPPAAPPGGGDGEPAARGADVEGVRVHSVRLAGLVAHQEVILGGPGQTLTIRHDSLDRVSFMPGVLMAVKAVPGRPGLTVGLDALLEA